MSSLARKLAAAAGALALAAAMPAAADEAAIRIVERLHSALVELAGASPPPTPAERIEALAPVVRETHDLETMGRLTVRRFWRDWSEAERGEFLDAFERFSIATYASRFALIGADTFEILGGESTGEDRAEVRAVIRRADDDDVTMDYVLQHDGEQFRITSVLADGVSELSLMASEYFEILDTEGFDALIAELESRIAALA